MENIFEGLDAFLKNNNAAKGVISQEEVEGSAAVEKEALEGKEKDGEEKPQEGLTLEEIEAEMKRQAQSSDNEEEEEESNNGEEDGDSRSKKDDQPDDEDSEVWKGLSAILKDKGIVEEDFDSPDKMVEVFGKEVEKGVSDWIESLPEEVRDIVEAASKGLKGQSLLSFIERHDEQVQLESIEDSVIEENADLAKNIVRAHLKATTKYSDEKIEKHISRLEDLDELVAEAVDAKNALIEIDKEEKEYLKEKAKQDQARAQKEREETLKAVNDNIMNTKEIIPGIKLSEKEQKELHKMITTPVEIRGNQAVSAAMKLREQDPIEFEKKLNYFIMKGFFDGKFDDIAKTAQTKVVSKIEKDLEAAAKKLISKGSGKVREESDPNLKESITTAWKNRKK